MLTYFENYPRKKTCAFNVARLLSTSVLIERIKILEASCLVAKLPGGEMTSNPASHNYYVVTRACGRRSDWCGLYVLAASISPPSPSPFFRLVKGCQQSFQQMNTLTTVSVLSNWSKRRWWSWRQWYGRIIVFMKPLMVMKRVLRSHWHVKIIKTGLFVFFSFFSFLGTRTSG